MKDSLRKIFESSRQSFFNFDFHDIESYSSSQPLLKTGFLTKRMSLLISAFKELNPTPNTYYNIYPLNEDASCYTVQIDSRYGNMSLITYGGRRIMNPIVGSIGYQRDDLNSLDIERVREIEARYLDGNMTGDEYQNELEIFYESVPWLIYEVYLIEDLENISPVVYERYKQEERDADDPDSYNRYNNYYWNCSLQYLKDNITSSLDDGKIPFDINVR